MSPHSPAQHSFGATYTEGLIAAIAMFLKEFFDAAFNPYHPEKYYMRGPGPACRAKARTITSEMDLAFATPSSESSKRMSNPKHH